jgi:ubiquitin-conjugating enzyme E2 M
LKQVLSIYKKKDFKDLDDRWTKQLEFPPNCSTKAVFYITIYPDDGIWKGVGHKFEISVPVEYPIEPPKVTCKTRVYHPNIDQNGAVCLNILRKDWRPILPLNAVFTGLHLLFLEPNPDDPLDLNAAAGNFSFS